MVCPMVCPIHVCRVADTQLHCLDLATWTWSQPATTGTGPTPRQGHTMCAVDDRLYMFGGMGGMSFYDDLFVLDTAAMAWSTPDVSGQVRRQARERENEREST